MRNYYTVIIIIIIINFDFNVRSFLLFESEKKIVIIFMCDSTNEFIDR